MPENLFRNWKDFLWPLGGTLLGLLVVPIAIAQYPEFFNENVWVLPVSVIAVSVCWILPLLLHDRSRRIYSTIKGIRRIGPILSALVFLITVAAVLLGGTTLFSLHSRHLAKLIEKDAQARSEAEGKTSSSLSVPVPSEQPPRNPLPTGSPPAARPTFSESGDFVVLIGGTPHKITGANTRQHPANVAPFGDANAIRAYIEENKLYIDALLHYAPDKPPLKLIHNELRDRPPEWDRNFDHSAIEIVDANLTPRFQLIYRDPRVAVLRGVFQFPGGVVVLENKARFFIGSSEDKVAIAPLFKYPSRLHQGEEVSPLAIIADQTNGTSPPPTQNCPNGICIGGANFGNPTVNNYGPDLPLVSWSIVDKPPLKEAAHPEVWVHISIDRDFLSAKFAVLCDRPCKAVQGRVNSPHGGFRQTDWGSVPNRADVAAFVVNGPNPMPYDASYDACVESTDAMPPRILNVKTLKIEPPRR